MVIGAGLGGLACAIDLAARGQAVTVVEKATASGGKMREIRVGDWAVDSGPTVLTLRGVFEDLFADAGDRLDRRLTLRPAERLARHVWPDGARLDLFSDPERSAAAIGDFAGAAEVAGFRAFRAEAKAIFETLDGPYLRASKGGPLDLARRIGLSRLGELMAIRPFETLWGALGRHFRDPRLRQLFGRYATYCGSSPFAAPATLMLISHVEQQGVWLVEGGMQRVAEAMEALGRRLGVTFRHEAEVGAIAVAAGGVAGVTLVTGERLPARRVVANADARALASGAFGPDAAQALDLSPPRDRSLSALTWSMEAETRGFDLLRHNVFFSGDYPAEFHDIFRGDRLPRAPTIYVCAQDREAASSPAPGPERLFVLVNAPPTGDRRDLSQSEMNACEAYVFDHLAGRGLAISRTPERTVLTRPADFHRMFPATGGALYGPATHGWASAFQRPGARTRIPGLYMAGGGAHPGAGAPMAVLSGRLAAAALLQDLDRGSTRWSRRGAMSGGTLTPSAATASSA